MSTIFLTHPAGLAHETPDGHPERVARLEAKLAECEAQMGDPAVYADAGKVADLGRSQLQLRNELEQAEAELLALYD